MSKILEVLQSIDKKLDTIMANLEKMSEDISEEIDPSLSLFSILVDEEFIKDNRLEYKIEESGEFLSSSFDAFKNSGGLERMIGLTIRFLRKKDNVAFSHIPYAQQNVVYNIFTIRSILDIPEGYQLTLEGMDYV